MSSSITQRPSQYETPWSSWSCTWKLHDWLQERYWVRKKVEDSTVYLLEELNGMPMSLGCWFNRRIKDGVYYQWGLVSINEKRIYERLDDGHSFSLFLDILVSFDAFGKGKKAQYQNGTLLALIYCSVYHVLSYLFFHEARWRNNLPGKWS